MQARDVKPCGTAVNIGPIAKEKGRNDTRKKSRRIRGGKAICEEDCSQARRIYSLQQGAEFRWYD